MRNKKKQTPCWSDVKKAIESLGEQGLLELISDIYNLSKDNKDFLHTRFSIGDDILAPYKKIIKLTLPDHEQGDFRKRLKKIMLSSDGIGWGYHDGLCDDYYGSFKMEDSQGGRAR